MNIFKQTKAKKVLASVVGLTVGFTMTVGSASAATIEELQAQIASLQAALVALSGGTTTTTGTCYTFGADLELKSEGADVKELQKVLNSDAATLVASAGVGSTGNETNYFGGLTKAAVMKFQTKHGIAPVAGYVGPKTRAKLNSMCSTTGTGTGTGTTTPTGAVTVALAASTPADGGLLQGQANAGLTDLEFKGAGVVTSVTLKRSGFSDQNALTAVYLYDGNTRLTDGYTFNTAGDLVMNNLNIVVSGSKVISVKADITADDTDFGSQSSIAIALTSYTAAGVATATNVQGNTIWTVAGTLAGVTIGTQTLNTGTPTVNAGTANYTIWGNTISVSTRAVALKGAVFKIVGSAPANAFSNVSLIVDGVKVGNSAVVDAQSNVTFDASAAPLTLTTGSHSVEVRADIVNGSSRTFYVSLQKAGDIILSDSTYGVNTSISPFTANNTVTITIGEGTISLTKDSAFDTSNSVTSGASNVAIAKYKLQAYGEDVKVMQVDVTASTTPGTGLKNVTLYLNGAQVGSSKNVPAEAEATALEFTLGSALIVPAGTTASFEVRADINNAANVAFEGTIVTTVEIPTDQAQGMSSYSLTEAGSPGTTSVTAAVATATLAKAAGFTNQSVGENTAAVKVGSFVIKAGATEGVRVTNLNVSFDDLSLAAGAATGTVETTDMANLTISLDGGLTKLAPVSPSLSSNNFSVDFTVAAGVTKTVDVYVDVTAASTGEKIATKLLATARGASSNISISTGDGFATAYTGQTMTVGSGVLGTVTITSNTDTNAQYIVGGVTGRNIVRYNLTATGGSVTLQELTFNLSTTTDGAIVSLSASGNQGGTTCSAPVIGATVTMTGCNIPVPQGFGGTDLVVTADFGTVGYNGIASNAGAIVDLTTVKSTNGIASATVSPTVDPSATMRLVASMPTFTLSNSGVGTLRDGEVKVGTLTVTAASGGSVNLNVLPVTISVSGGTARVNAASTTNAVFVKEGNTTIALDSDGLSSDTASAAAQLTFTDNLIVTAGASRTFDIYAVFTGISSSVDESAQISLASAANLNWDDVSGGNTSPLTGTLLSAYPTNLVTIND